MLLAALAASAVLASPAPAPAVGSTSGASSGRATLTPAQEQELRDVVPTLFGDIDPKLKVARLKGFAPFKKNMYCSDVVKKVPGAQGKCSIASAGQVTLPSDHPLLAGYRVVYQPGQLVVAVVADFKPEYAIGGFRPIVVPILEEKWGKSVSTADGTNTWTPAKGVKMQLARGDDQWQIREMYE